MQSITISILLIILVIALKAPSGHATGSLNHTIAADDEPYKLVWADEFDSGAGPDPAKWKFEKGFVRNHEFQWYQPDNAACANGMLIIEARREHKPNPDYVPGSTDWKKSSPTIEYTSSSINTSGKQSWQYGRFEMRARIDTSMGLWPAWWTLGVRHTWPSNGEIDIMEYYRKDPAGQYCHWHSCSLQSSMVQYEKTDRQLC